MRTRSLLALLMLCLSWSAAAQDLEPQIRALIEEFQAHRRVAIGYLRTGNTELGGSEIDRLRDFWRQRRQALPVPVMPNEVLMAALNETEGMIEDSANALDRGEPDQARLALENASHPLAYWRASRGIRLFSDCIAEAGAAYELLDVHRIQSPDFARAETVEQIRAAAAITEKSLRHCDSEAPEATRKDPEFRRLLEGFLGSLAQLPEALSRRDGGYFHRLMIEQRSFARLLAFRFG